MAVTKDDVARQFGRTAEAYATSAGHAKGADLGLLVGLLAPDPEMRVLDVATGAGHTAAAIAPLVREVVATDLAPEMIERTRELAAARGLANLTALVMDVEALAFPDHSFDAVACRIAPHHFLDIQQALREMARVLRPGGQLALEDSCAPTDPALDRFINEVERRRDATHRRNYTEAEWRAMLDVAGLEVAHAALYRKTHDVADWIARAGIDQDAAERVYAAFAAAPPQARAYFALQCAGGRATSFTDDKLLLRAVKRGEGVAFGGGHSPAARSAASYSAGWIYSFSAISASSVARACVRRPCCLASRTNSTVVIHAGIAARHTGLREQMEG